MSLNATLDLLLSEYADASRQVFAKNALAGMLRDDIPKELSKVIDNERYMVDGSPGQGNWADVPWIAIFDRLVTESAQQGYYLVYLFKADCSGVYLSLNQGVTTIRQQYGAGTRKALATRARDFATRLGAACSGFQCGPINLGAKKNGLGSDYEQGSICARYYARSSLPGDAVLEEDLRRFLIVYRRLVDSDASLFLRADVEDDETALQPENLMRLRQHKRIERNRSLAKQVKRLQGYTCSACGFNFEDTYGAIGRDFIEAHHLVPICELTGDVAFLDPKRDFKVLCSNCHRMIHRTEFVDRVEEFRAKYLVRAKPSESSRSE